MTRKINTSAKAEVKKDKINEIKEINTKIKAF